MKSIATVLAAFCLASSSGVFAADYPSKPIRLLVPLAAGSSGDILGRTIGAEIGAVLGANVIVENKPGAGGTIAMREIAGAAPDGYTIGLASQGNLVFNMALYSQPGYDSLKDLTPVIEIAGVSNVMIVPPNSSFMTPEDVIAEAQKNPGRVTFSSGGSGTSHHLSGVLFGQKTGTELLHVPYNGAPAGILSVMSGEVNVGFFNTPTVVSQIRDGRLRGLAVTSLDRSPLLPDLETLDSRAVKGYEINTWFGLIGPAGLPEEIVAKLHGAVAEALTNPAVQENLGAVGFELAEVSSSADFHSKIEKDFEIWPEIIKASGAAVN
jgi:tripartite-type tricarboxylate transporter receptor subunit TctC